eukprot:Tbor_TRINITY_DN3720_c0_g1::TRINITY_DN3720_c0_g1_i1::g.2390::m.2390/K01512/acyP; acylphosphatase
MSTSATIFVSGKVQGVFFRKYTEKAAAEIGDLRGTVQNLTDGRVRIDVIGSMDKIEALREWCASKGSPKSVVSDVEMISPLTAEEERLLNNIKGFSVKR